MPIDPMSLHQQLMRPVVRPLFRSLGISASGLEAQRKRIDVIATNIANAETTRTAEGGPYRRRQVMLESQAYDPQGGLVEAGRLIPTGEEAGELPLPTLDGEGGVAVTGVFESASEGALVYDPGHPDADENGYVRMPNVSITDEMVDLMDARRMYEANATVFQAMKAMLQRALQI
jgi:flagellar basal-body rod protein FlgC